MGSEIMTTELKNLKWVAENLTEMDHSIKRMLKLIEENNEFSEANCQNNPVLISGFKEFDRIYQSLATRYNHLTQELLRNSPPEDYDTQITPNGKLDLIKPGRKSVSVTSASGNSDISPNADYESSSSSDSESESFYSSLNHYFVSPINMGSQVLTEKKGKLDDEERILKLGEKMSYVELMEKIVKYEEELRIMSLKLQDSEQGVENLKGELKKSKSSVVLAENLHAELEAARNENNIKEIEVETEKRRVFDLHNQVLVLETKLLESDSKMKKLVIELETSIEHLEASDDEISKLREALSECQQGFLAEKAKLQCDLAVLSEEQIFSETRIKELESRARLLEDTIRQADAEKMDMKALFDTKKTQQQDEINRLKADIVVRTKRIETLSKVSDEHKLKYGMLMGVKNEILDKAENLKVELRSRDVQIGEMEENLNQLHKNYEAAVSESGKAKNFRDEMRLKLQELENVVEKQRSAITEGEEKKREAIRQLCFSLDHYRSGYRQLVRSLSGNKRHVIMAV